MTTGNQTIEAEASQSGANAPLEMKAKPGWGWVLKWVVLMTVAIPASLLLMAPFAAALMSIANLGSKAGLIANVDKGIFEMIGFGISFSLTLAAAQWLLLRSYLPRSARWFWATGIGLFTSCLLAGLGVFILSDVQVDPSLGMASMFLLIGFTLGVAQWLVLRWVLPKAYWILVIDLVGACSFLLVGGSITNLLEILVVLFLPGLVTGVGLWTLFNQAPIELEAEKDKKALVQTGSRSIPKVWIGFGMAALVPMFFLCIWIYAASQLALAKNEGIYPTVEEAVILTNKQGWGGAEVVKIENVRASVNQHDGSQPHVWFGGADVYLDRVPLGGRWDHYAAGSYYLHVEEGWVHVPEGALPEFIGWVMKLYGMEGVDELAP